MITQNGITIIGLGPGEHKHLTLEAANLIDQQSEIYLRTRHHPLVKNLPKEIDIKTFDDFYEENEKFEDVYENIIQKVLELGKRSGGVVYAVPGHPYVAEATSPEIVRRAKLEGIPVRVIEGLSFIEPACTALAIDPFPYLIIVDALELGQRHYPSFAPEQPLMIGQIYSYQIASEVKLTLTSIYPDDHPVRLVHGAGTENEVVEDLCLYEIDRSAKIGLLTILYVPELEGGRAFESFQEVIAMLRAPEGCPWDRKQTHQSLRPYLIEETYELIDALDADDPEKMEEELGDVLLQILLHAEIGAEEGEFTINDVIKGIHDKIVRRHPHVFKQLDLQSVEQVVETWEKIKEKERKENGDDKKNKGILDGLPHSSPALLQAQQIQERTARVGFDWDSIEPVIDKVNEELLELKEAQNDEERASELGDLLFSVVNLSRWYKADAESALRETNLRFRNRFKYIEMKAKEAGRSLHDMTLEEMDAWWDEAKKL